MTAVNAESLARECRTSAEECITNSERVLAGAQVMIGVNEQTAMNKAREAIFLKGQASAYTTVAEALERLIATPVPDG